MTSNLTQPKALADCSGADGSAATGRSTAKARSTDPSSARAPFMRGALLRALLAGAVALLVLLLPGQLAASRADVTAVRDAQLESGRASPGAPSPWDRAAGLEIRHGDRC